MEDYIVLRLRREENEEKDKCKALISELTKLGYITTLHNKSVCRLYFYVSVQAGRGYFDIFPSEKEWDIQYMFGYLQGRDIIDIERAMKEQWSWGIGA